MERTFVPVPATTAYGSGSSSSSPSRRDQPALVEKTATGPDTTPVGVGSTTFTVKAFWKEEIVKFFVTNTTTFKDLKKILCEAFKMPEYWEAFDLKYEDEEGDKVAMDSDEHLTIALRSCGLSTPSTTLKLFVVKVTFDDDALVNACCPDVY